MHVSVIGAGYVGLVTAACLADVGNVVVCVDVDAGKIEKLNRSQIPIYEPGLNQLVERNAAVGRLRFSTDYERCGIACNADFHRSRNALRRGWLSRFIACDLVRAGARQAHPEGFPDRRQVDGTGRHQ